MDPNSEPSCVENWQCRVQPVGVRDRRRWQRGDCSRCHQSIASFAAGYGDNPSMAKGVLQLSSEINGSANTSGPAAAKSCTRRPYIFYASGATKCTQRLHVRIFRDKYLHKKYAPEMPPHFDADAVFRCRSCSSSRPRLFPAHAVHAQELLKAAVEGNLSNILKVFVLKYSDFMSMCWLAYPSFLIPYSNNDPTCPTGTGIRSKLGLPRQRRHDAPHEGTVAGH